MGTNALLIARKINGSCRCTRLQWDGYLSHAGDLLLKHYNEVQRVDALIQLGDLSQLDSRISCPKGHSFDTPAKGCTIAYFRDRGEMRSTTRARKYTSFKQAIDAESAEYVYYWDGIEWFWYNKNAFYPLRVLLPACVAA